jgi:hypothetical protein
LYAFAQAIYLMRILVFAFLAIFFLQPGICKIIDRRGNLEWLNGHFAKSPLASMVPFLLTVLTILEVAAGAVSAVGCVLVIVLRDSTVAFCGAVISAVACIALFLAANRERLRWRGSAIPYFLLTLVATYLLVQG